MACGAAMLNVVLAPSMTGGREAAVAEGSMAVGAKDRRGPVPAAPGSNETEKEGYAALDPNGAVDPSLVALDSSETAVHIPAAPDPSEVATRICDAHGLSAREKDVFTLLAKGYTSPRIQKELYIAAGTVNYHTRNVYAKLGVHTKQELIGMYEAELNR